MSSDASMLQQSKPHRQGTLVVPPYNAGTGLTRNRASSAPVVHEHIHNKDVCYPSNQANKSKMPPFTFRNVLTFYGAVSSIATLLIPVAVTSGYYLVIAARIFQGFGASILFSSIGSISEGWAPIAEISTYIAFLSAGFQLSNIITMPLSGMLCSSSLGWRAIYYIYGAAALIVTTVFFGFFRDTAHVHRNVSEKEMAKISHGRSAISGRKRVPYLAICKDKHVLAIWASALGGNMSLMTLMIYGPTYLNKALGLNVQETGLANSIPYILATLVKFVAGPLSDNLTSVPDTWKMIFFGAVSQGGMAVGFFVMALTRVKIIAQIAYTTAIVLAGVNMVGVVKCAQMVSRQYIHFVMAVNSMISWIAIFILPMIIGVLCPTHSPEEWAVFYIAGGIWVIIMNIPFPFLATTQAADFTKPGWGEKKSNGVVDSEL
uniref:MFS domain-containing protein n=1 Tax=Caenorhabditis japonica TaxID=281687 RepID=A0A8R1ICW2_CAEJA